MAVSMTWATLEELRDSIAATAAAERRYREQQAALYAEATRLLVVAGRSVVGKHNHKLTEPLPADPARSFADALQWARHVVGDAGVRDVLTPLHERGAREFVEFNQACQAAQHMTDNLLPRVIFPRTPDRRVVYEVTVSTYNTQGFSASSYARFDAHVATLKLRRRGFTPMVLLESRRDCYARLGMKWKGSMRTTQGLHAYRVEVDAPPEVAQAIPLWRLDLATWCRLAEECGINFYAWNPLLECRPDAHTPSNPVGPWEVPKDQRWGRDDPRFADHRANEDEHCRRNGAARE